MSVMVEEDVVFGEWTTWDQRRSLRNDPKMGGIYLLAYCSTGKPPVKASRDSLPFEVVYVGTTKNLNFRPGNSKHAGLERYHAQFGDEETKETKQLFLAIAPLYKMGCADYALQRVYAEYVEVMLVWNYTKQHKHRPRCTTAKGNIQRTLKP